ncbi:peptidoglycan DD-metalloendopeptidase family protein [Streptomyces sp. 3MP-14]|uniref:Peptidoglycan DD-metalloendopeptidase family protein n=1 Tax=Streptomyces mimosae TaxID=2586635 RepID=A0A5N5ZPX0_9ACTN|nr:MULTISPECIES: M23 family metallopeptidase [Streptomyces]KAB8158345.1 peptidoglycan DD-metalloendopeptidase family protein [Streptomyces mimosae]KAB8177232.1 peptidoglycan DD-metalloendopeptidase family protein [Streptomyces sp. 3MP-14]
MALAVLGRTCWIAFLAYVLADLLAGLPALGGWLLIAAALGSQLAAALLLRRDEPRDATPLTVAPPVAGSWSALNSPADRVPSHGIRKYGQSHAIDVVAERPEDAAGPARPRFGWWPVTRRNADFPAFGAPLLAVADATVLTAHDGQRDHRSRNSWPALLWLFLSGAVRDVVGADRVIGNHLVLDLGGGTYALYAHLRRESLTVRPGERVRAGQELARCGNTGNSSEPHLHFQLMDRPHPDTACGLPFRWAGVGVPRAGEHFTVPAPAAEPVIPHDEGRPRGKGRP